VLQDVLKATEIAKKPRRNISSVIAGKAITEIDVSQKIEEYQLETAKKTKPNGSKTKNTCYHSVKIFPYTPEKEWFLRSR
jgi:hypothetical protein